MSLEHIWYDAFIILHRSLGLILKPFGALSHMLDTVFLEVMSKCPHETKKYIYTQQHTYMTLILWVINK